MKNVALIETLGSHIGLDNYNLNILKALKATKSINPILYTSNISAKNSEHKIYNYFNGVYGKQNKIIRGFRFIIATLKSLKSAKKNKATIIHLNIFHWDLLEYFILFCSKIIFNMKTVSTIHDVESFASVNNSSKSKHKKFANLLDGVLFFNEFSRNEFFKNLKEEKIESTLIKDLGFSKIVKKTKDECREKLNIPKNKFVVLFFGQIKKVKGIDILLQSINHVVDLNQNIEFVIAGRPWKDNLKNYEDYISKNNISSFIKLNASFIAEDQLPYYFQSADMGILPYKKIYNSEVLLNFLSYKLPVLCSDLPVFSEIISDKENGLIFKSEDSLDLANKIIFAINNQELLNQIGDNGYKYLTKNWDLEEVGNLYNSFYDKIIFAK